MTDTVALDWPRPLYTTRHRAKPGGCYFDEEAADNAVKFFTLLRHSKGRKWADKPFNLEPWQQEEVIRPLFGWKLADGTRLYRTLYLEVPRKNGKSTLAAGLAGKLLLADREPGVEVYSAAADKDQARIVFAQLADMVRKSKPLKNAAIVQKNIIKARSGGEYKVLSADVSTKWGFNIHGLLFDELHAQDNSELWEALTTAQGARDQPITVAITTAGYNQTSICWDMHQLTIAVAKEEAEDPSILGVIYAADEKDDWTDPAVWYKANPNLGVSISERFLEQECKKAKALPVFQNAFRRLYLNQWTSQDVRLIPMNEWDECPSDPVDPESLRGKSCFGGIDLASTTDLAAFALAFPAGEGDTKEITLLVKCYTPEDNLRDRGIRDRAAYTLWKEQGWLTTIPGKTIDTDFIRADVMKAAEMYDLRDISYDRWGSADFVRRLEDDGAILVMMGQGYASMSSPTKQLLELTLNHKLHHGGNPILHMAANNVAGLTDAAGNVKPDKSKSSGRIDPLVASIMAIDGATRRWEPARESSHETFLCDVCLKKDVYTTLTADVEVCPVCGTDLKVLQEETNV